MRRALLGAVLALGACRPEPAAAPNPTLRRDLELTSEQQAWLFQLAAEADEHPDDFEAHKRSGFAHMWFCLSGVLSLQDRAEVDLERAFALDPTDRDLTRSLGRFYNLRAIAGDDSKAAMQVKVYRAYLGDEPLEHMNTREFVAWSFSRLGVILEHRNAGRLLAALHEVRELEKHLAARVKEHPDDIELWALAGNFSFFFAGNIPFDRKKRVEAAVRYFTRLRADWDDLRPGARDPSKCPNTRENFMFELAEGLVVLKRVDDARPIYEELTRIRPPRTRAKEEVAWVAGERLRHLDHYDGDMRLMPPWPSDVGNCVVCHSYTSDVPLTSLYSVERPRLDDIPTHAEAKPIPGQ